MYLEVHILISFPKATLSLSVDIVSFWKLIKFISLTTLYMYTIHSDCFHLLPSIISLILWYLPSLQVLFSQLFSFVTHWFLSRAVHISAHLEISRRSWLIHCWNNNWRQRLNFPQNPPLANSSPGIVRTAGVLPRSGLWLAVDRSSLVQKTAAAMRLCLQWLCHTL